MINGVQVFHTAIVNEKGPEAGYSQVIVGVDPSNPYTPAIGEFARNTLAQLPAFMHHYLRKVKGIHESTVKRLEECFILRVPRLLNTLPDGILFV
jgi:MoaA/NifB/PqqE/SkfB family radical SAM enzyme